MKAGNRVLCLIANGEVCRLQVRPLNRLFGKLQHDGRAVTVEEMERAVAKAAMEG